MALKRRSLVCRPRVPRQPASGSWSHLQAQVAGSVLEGGGDSTVLDFVVAVAGPAATHAHGRNTCHGLIPLAAQVPALTGEIDHGHAGGGMVMPILAVRVVMVMHAPQCRCVPWMWQSSMPWLWPGRP